MIVVGVIDLYSYDTPIELMLDCLKCPAGYVPLALPLSRTDTGQQHCQLLLMRENSPKTPSRAFLDYL